MTKTWWFRLSRYAFPHWRGLTVLGALMLITTGAEVLRPWPLKLLVDYVFRARPLPPGGHWLARLPGACMPAGLTAWLAASTVVLLLLGRIVGLVSAYVRTGVGSRMTYALGADLFEHLQRLSLQFHGRWPAGDLVRRVTTDSSCARDLMMDVGLTVVGSLTSLVAMFSLMWVLDPWLSLVALATVPFLIILIRLLDKPMEESSYRHQQAQAQVMSTAEETLTALPVVQAFGRERYEDQRFRGSLQKALVAYQGAVRTQLSFTLGVTLASAVGTAATMGLGGWHVLRGVLSLGSLLVFLAYLASLYAPLEQLAYVSSGLASAAARARRVLEVLDSGEQVVEVPDARPVPALPPGRRGHIRLDHVTFGYEPGQPVLHDITLEAKPGEVIALVGPTGAGKTTLVNLIQRFYDPWDGSINLEGIDLRQLQLASLRGAMALVLQESFLLPVTVAENIAYGRPEASLEEIKQAARAARAHEFIERLPQGYSTVIAEGGATLSGGEKQRLGIARAILKDAPVLILDEPTSALDAETEASLMGALEHLWQGRTTFIIAHRWSTVQRADRVVVIEQGRIVETGLEAELRVAGGAYEHFYRLQTQTSRAAVGGGRT